MDPTSTEESTPWDPITGKLRAHANLKLPKGTRDALSKHTGGLGDTRGLSSTSTRCPTTAATSRFSTAPGSPRSPRFDLEDTLDLTTRLNEPAQLKKSMSKTSIRRQGTGLNRSNSVPRPPSGSGVRAVRFAADQRSPSRERGSEAMRRDPGRYDLDPSSPPSRQGTSRFERDIDSPPLSRQGSRGSGTGRPLSRQNSGKTLGTTGSMVTSGSGWKERGDGIPAAMKADPARYDVAPRGSAAAREYEDKAKHVMHTKADPRNDMLNDGSGHNADGDGQTMMGIEIKERFSDMRTAFIKIDADFDGKITHEELMQACLEWNIPLSEATRVMNSVDTDHKGFIDFDEFAKRFDPVLEVSADDDELLRLYQAGIMGDESPIKLRGVQHGTSTADPFVDEAQHYRTENGDLRGRLARSMQQIERLTADLKASRARERELANSLDNANQLNAELRGQNSELEGRNSALRRKLEDAEDDKRRMAKEIDNLWGDRDSAMKATRMRQDDLERLRRERASEHDDDEAERRRLERELKLEREMGARRRARELDDEDEDEMNTVFVYGIEGCQKCDAMYKALDKAKVPYKCRDFNKDKRFEKACKKSGIDMNGAIYAPVVCLGNKAWVKDTEETQLVPFEVEVAMELRRELGLYKPPPEKVREDIDIDTEIFQRYTTMQEAFLKLDDNQDGFITADEIKVRCKQWNIPTSEAERTIQEADKDGKGFIDFDEFAKRFGSLWSNGNRGPLRSLAPAPNHQRPRQPRAS